MKKIDKLAKELAAQNKLTALEMFFRHSDKFGISVPAFNQKAKEKVDEILNWSYSQNKSFSTTSKDS